MTRLHTYYQYILISLALLSPAFISAQSTAPTFTTINLNNTVLQSPVKRLGMNLGQTNYYDAGQMMKNLIVSNPGFEGGISQSMILCGSGTATSCTDSITYSGWPADYWDGATYTFVYGTATGRTGTVSTFTPANNQNGNNVAAVFNFSDSGTVPSAGDYMIVSKVMPGHAYDGWNYTLGSNGTVSTNTTDLPSDTQGKQTIVLTAPASGDSATITYYFDSTAGHTFLQLNGNYNLSFKAKAVSGSGNLYVSLKRLTNPAPVYVYQAPLQLTSQWQTYNFPFSASESGLIGTVELDFSTSVPYQALSANQIELDDTSLVQLNTDPTNNTVFRDPVVNTLKQLNPGVLRFWFNQLGETLDNMLAPALGRQRSAYSAYTPDVDHVSYGLAEFLQLCQTVGSGSSSPIEPWIVLPITLSNAEASNVIDYLAGPTTTVYGAKRAAAGQTAPWTSVFPKIHLELGNEAWNNLFYGGNMTSPQAYGTHGQAVFAIMRNNANYNASSFDLMLNGTAYNPGGEAAIQSYCNNNDSFAAQPYLILNANDPGASGLTGADAIENLFGSTFAEPEAFVTASGTAEGIAGGLVLQNQAAAQSSGRPVAFAVTETNISPYGGSITQTELNSYVSSLGAGLAVIDSMMQNMRIGVLTQNLFDLPEYTYYRGDGKSMSLFGSVVDMGVTNLQRPQFLAEEVVNNAIGANTNMVQTVHTGLDPTWNQPSVNSVQLNNAHYLQSFAFNSGDNYSLIIFNTNRSASEQVNFAGANVPGGTVQMTQLTSGNITDTNETSSVVAPVSSTLSSFNATAGMTLPPFSVTTLTWTAPGITNVTVTGVTGTSATISWNTDDSTSTSVINYGTTTTYGSQTAPTPAGTTQSVTLTGLTAGTTYNFAIAATSGAGATSSSANYTFGTTASFTISAPSSVSLAQGQTGSVPVLVSATNGYTGSITLSLSGLPTGATDTFQTTSGSASLVLTIPSTVLAGTYPLTITGTAGGTIVTAPLSLVVSGASQTQTITLTSIPNQYVGATATVSATASSGLPVAFTVVQNGVCSISGTTLNFLKVGNCGVIASQAGNSTYEPASVSQVVVVSSQLPPQTITFNSIANQTVGTTLSLSASASSGLKVSFASSTSSVCTVSASTATFVATGTCTITASQAGSSSYAAAPNVPQSFNVTGQTQTITFASIPTQTASTPLTLAATSTSSLAVSFTSTTQSICTASGTTATFITAGTCTITASQAGNTAYAAATPVSQTFTVNAAPVAQTITFGSIATQNVGTQLTLSATSTSNLVVSLASTTTPVCTVSGTTATFLTTGTCGITASQAGNSTYLAATPVSRSFTVNVALLSQTITFGTIPVQSVGTPLVLSATTATASSGLTVTFTSATPAICTVSGTSAQFLAAGTCTLTASQAGNSTYAAATPVSQNVTVNPTSYSQTITFAAIATQTVGTPLSLTASATSNLAVGFASMTPTVCTVSATTATFSAAGTCSITASQPGNNGYAAATPVTQSFTVNPGPQTITFGTIAAQTVGTPLALTANATSGLAVSFASTTGSICTVSGSTATFVAAGSCSITASQTGNSSYAAAAPVTQSFTVNPALQAQTISFGTIATQTVGTPLALSATDNSGLAITYTSTTTSVCAVSGSTAAFLAAGTCGITASQPGNGTYSAATPVTQSFTVNAAPKAQTITFPTITAQQVGSTLALSATATSGQTVAFASTTTSVCTVSSATATFVSTGTCSITASQAGNTAYLAATPVTQSFTVNGQGQIITVNPNPIPTQQVGTSLTLTASASSGLTVSLSASPSAICTLSGGTASFAAPGTCTITASQAGNSTYGSASVSQSFTVQGAAANNITVSLASVANIYGIYNDGSTVANGGIDGYSYAYSASLLGTTLSNQGITYSFGTPGAANGIASTTLTLPSGNYSTLNFLGTGVDGNQASQVFTVTYTDGTTSTFTQSLSDWGYPQSNSGETIASTMSYRVSPTGTQNTGPWYLYAYSFSLNSAKTVKSFTLPSNSHAVVLAVTLYASSGTTSQTVTFGSVATQTVGTTLSLKATATSGLTVSYTASPSSVCTVSGATASFAAAGTCTITASQAGNATYAAAAAVSQTFTVQAAAATAQTITFSSIAAQKVGTTLTLTATASSGLAVSYASSTPSVCTVSGTTASFAAAGTCTITASQAGNATYAAATAVSQSFTVQAAASTTATTSVSLASVANVYGFFTNGSAITNGGLDASSYAYSANLLGTSLTYQGIPYTLGTAGTANTASSTTVTLPAGNYSALNFLGTATFGNHASESFVVTYTDGTTATFTQSMSDWGSPQSYNGESNALSMAYRLTSTGAQQAGPWYVYAYSFALNTSKTVKSLTLPNDRNALVLAVTLSGLANNTAQTITFGTIAAQTVGTPLTLGATASSGLTVSYASSTTAVCTVSGTTATFAAAGTCTLTASQAGNSTYAAATSVSQSFTVNAALKSQTITFGTVAAQTVGTPLTLGATASSGLTVSYASSTTAVCTVSGTTATFAAAGTCTLTASQAGSTSYAAATSVSQSFTVNAPALKSQTITFGTIAAQTVGTPLTLGATASSGLTVSYASTTTSICTASGTTATFVAAGTCTLTASQAGSTSYAAATSVSQSFTVNAAALKSQTITFGTIAAQTVGTPLTLGATASSGLTVSYASTTTSICTASGTTATFVAAGTCTLTASQAGNSTYAAAASVSQSFTVNAALKSQSITFGTVAAQTVGTPLTLGATASSGLTVSYASSTTSICTVSGTTATFVAAGTCTLTASQAGNTSYSAASPVSQSFTVNAALKSQTITFGTVAAQAVGTPLTLTASASSGLTVSYASTTTSICTVSGTTATFVAAGTCTLTASQAGNSTYAAATSVSQSFTVNAGPTVVSLASAFNIYGIFANGTSVTNSGLDNSSYAYSSTLLGSSLTLGGTPFTLGTVGKADAVANAKVTLPSGSYSTLKFLATGVQGNQLNQKFTVTYTDGTTTVATQSLSDWGNPQSYTGETTGSSMSYRVTPTGGQQTGPWYLYQYSIPLNSAKTVQSITLPSNRYVVVLSMTLSH